MSKSGRWALAEQEKSFLNGAPDDIDADWQAELADRLAAQDPERTPGHDYATEREYREHLAETRKES